MTSWDLGGVVVCKILEAGVASRYFKKKKPPKYPITVCRAHSRAVNRTWATPTRGALPGGGLCPEHLPKPQTNPCARVTRRGLGWRVRHGEPLSLPLGRPWAPGSGRQEPREQATLSFGDSCSPYLHCLAQQQPRASWGSKPRLLRPALDQGGDRLNLRLLKRTVGKGHRADGSKGISLTPVT